MAKAKQKQEVVKVVNRREKLKYNMPKSLKIMLGTCFNKEEKKAFKKLMIDVGFANSKE